MLRIILSMVKSLEKIAKQKKINYFLVTFVDLFGVQRAKLVPTRAIGEMQKQVQALEDLQHIWIFHFPNLICLLYLTQTASFNYLGNLMLAGLASDLVMNDKFMDQCPRDFKKPN